MPPNTEIDLTLVVNYEAYAGVPAFSHSFLSIVGYGDKWAWEEAALGSSGENICFDPHGTTRRSFITDMRPKLFDGKWKENIGGGDFTLMFGASGDLIYLKEVDAQIHANGPCLSNASYSSVTSDNSIATVVHISGGRTDDIPRIFISVKIDVLQNTKFSRLSFFQLGTENYNFNSKFAKIAVSGANGAAGAPIFLPQSCYSGPSAVSKKPSHLYSSPGPLKEAMKNVSAPWWIAFDGNEKPGTAPMYTGDKGVVIRSYRATLGGAEQNVPIYSILCDKLELGTPKGLRELKAGDFVEFKVEVLIYPRNQQYEIAKQNSQSKTLTAMSNMNTWQRVQANAIRGQILVEPLINVNVESHYPIRIHATEATNLLFAVHGSGKRIGFVPVVIRGLASPDVQEDSGLWISTDDSKTFSRLKQGSCDWQCYLNRYPDLQRVYGPTNTNQAKNHWQSNGQREGRDCTCPFWQVNYERVTNTYEIVYNVEFGEAVTVVAFGADPANWATTTTRSTTKSVTKTTGAASTPGSTTRSQETATLAATTVITTTGSAETSVTARTSGISALSSTANDETTTLTAAKNAKMSSTTSKGSSTKRQDATTTKDATVDATLETTSTASNNAGNDAGDSSSSGGDGGSSATVAATTVITTTGSAETSVTARTSGISALSSTANDETTTLTAAKNAKMSSTTSKGSSTKRQDATTTKDATVDATLETTSTASNNAGNDAGDSSSSGGDGGSSGSEKGGSSSGGKGGSGSGAGDGDDDRILILGDYSSATEAVFCISSFVIAMMMMQ